MPSELILASSSPRRAALLDQVGWPYRQVNSQAEELYQGSDPLAGAEVVALRKAIKVSRRYPHGMVVGADTVVIGPRGQVLGKPRTPAEAEDFLLELSGREHSVATGLALVWEGGKGQDISRSVSRVWMRGYDAAEAARYVATGEPLDKAGAYGIQGRGAVLVEQIEGCYYNIVGLPLSLLYQRLQAVGYRPPGGPEILERIREHAPNPKAGEG